MKHNPIIDELYTIEERYNMVTSGEYGVYEIPARAIQYRGFRKEHGTTGVYASYREALEAALCEFGDKQIGQETRTTESQKDRTHETSLTN